MHCYVALINYVICDYEILFLNIITCSYQLKVCLCLVGVGDIEIFISQYIQKKYCNITIYHNIFQYFHNTKLHFIISNKEIPNLNDVLL